MNGSKHIRSHGFTLVELILVIVIIGILAATALPKLMNVKSESRAAQVRATAAAVKTSASMIHLKWVVNGGNTASNLTLDLGNGQTVLVNSQNNAGWPSSQVWDVPNWGADLSMFTNSFHMSYANVTFLTASGCGFTYYESTGDVVLQGISNC